jgi:hypothetical protein
LVVFEIVERATTVTAWMVDDNDSVVRLTGLTKTVLPLRNAPRHACVIVFMTATESKKE